MTAGGADDEAQAALDRRDAALLRESIQEFPGPVAVYDADSRLIACNALYRWVHGEAFERVQRRVGGGPIRYEELVRESARTVVPPELLEAHIADRVRAQREADGRPIDRFYPGRGWFRIVKVRTPSGAVAGFATDITELKEKTLALEQARAAAEAANVAKSVFLANLSHELRTPLNAIIGMAEAMELGIFGPLSDRHRSYAGDIHRAGQHLLSLISDLLDLAKIEAGAMEVTREPFDLAGLFDECSALLLPIAVASQVRLHLVTPPPDLRLVADRRKIKQVLINLVGNAIKFSHPGGPVRVAAEAGPGGLRLTVEDEGVGLDEAQLGLAFEPFGRLKHSLTAGTDGSGLGLPIARRFVELHGGTLQLSSRPGAGTRAIVRLPPDCLA